MKCAVKLIIGEDRVSVGPGLISLLELIGDSSSVMEAAEKMEVSYSKAWKIIRQAEENLGKKLVLRKSGGPGGGSAQVTQEGLALIKAFRKTERQVSDFAAKKVLLNFKQ